MLSWVKLIWGLCIFKHGPQDLPFSRVMLGILIAINYAIAAIGLYYRHTLLDAFWVPAVLIAVMCAYIYVVLYLRRRPERAPQTLLAVLGSNALISLIAILILVFVVLLGLIVGSNGLMSSFVGVAKALIICCYLWSLVVEGNIFRHALSWPIFVGLAAAVGLEVINSIVLKLLV